MSFATAPSSLKLVWWEKPSTHPTFPCDQNGFCNPLGFTVGDVFFAEVVTALCVCRAFEPCILWLWYCLTSLCLSGARACVAIGSALCANRGELFRLKVGEQWECQLDHNAYREFTKRLKMW